jgi:hypothetical protein
LLAVMGNEELDVSSRQRCLDAVGTGALSPDESRELDEFLASPASHGLGTTGRP